MFSLDISMHKKGINISKLKDEGLVHLYLKATEGRNYIDPCLEEFYNKASSLDLPIGYYHFFTKNPDVEGQAEDFYNAVKGKKADLRYCLDMEVDLINHSDLARRFINRFEELMGKKDICCIYASAYYARDNFDQDIKERYPLWVANYNSSQNVDTGWREIAGWQYSESEIHQGQECDANIFYGSIVIPGGNQSSETTPSNPRFIPGGNQKVREIQTICCEYGFNITVDGKWGPQTEAAVKNLPLAGVPYRTPQLTTWVQLRLGITSDGIFGQDTYNAVVEFQRDHGLTQDGIVGFNTIKAMALC